MIACIHSITHWYVFGQSNFIIVRIHIATIIVRIWCLGITYSTDKKTLCGVFHYYRKSFFWGTDWGKVITCKVSLWLATCLVGGYFTSSPVFYNASCLVDAAVPYSFGSVNTWPFYNYIHRRQKSYRKRSLGVQSLLVFDLKVVHYLALSPWFPNPQ